MITMTSPTPRLTARHAIVAALIALVAIAAVLVPIVLLQLDDARHDREVRDEASQLDELLCYPGEPGC